MSTKMGGKIRRSRMSSTTTTKEHAERNMGRMTQYGKNDPDGPASVCHTKTTARINGTGSCQITMS